MSYRIKLLPEAKQDIKESIDWYNEQKLGLGKLFYQEVKSKLANLKENPLHYQISYRKIRNVLINKFPYQIHYRVEEVNKSIIVFAVIHTSRNPQIWRNRK